MSSEKELNQKKIQIDLMAGALINYDPEPIHQAAKAAAKLFEGFRYNEEPLRVAVTGASGAGKSVFADDIGRRLGRRAFDLDDFIPGGYTDDSKEYARRLYEGMLKVWQKLPSNGWIVEHVHALSTDMLKAFRPDFGILIEQPHSQIVRMSEARAQVARDENYIKRAITTEKTAKEEFELAPGRVIGSGTIWRVRKIES